MRLKIFTLFTFIFWGNIPHIFAQKTKQEPNLVPNPSFEEFRTFPVGWFFKGEDFTNLVKYWSSPTAASPDAYNPRVRVPTSWAENGFGKSKPHTGVGMAGITVFGCDGEKPHCREFVQIQLREPLVIGQRYAFEMWVLRLPKGIPVNNLSAVVNEKMVKQGIDEPLSVKTFSPQITFKNIVYAEQWTKLCDTFTAKTTGEWLIIGNFETDRITNHRPHVTNYDKVLFGYYYLDDVALRKIPPILPFIAPPDDWTKQPMKRGKTIVLKNILFESDRDELLPRSETELEKLLQILKSNPTMTLKIVGHTDANGNENYNIELSNRRAKKVANWLTKAGIAKNRLQMVGLGSSQPLVANENEELRQQNRRVEIEVLSE